MSDREPSQQWCEQIELSTCEGVSRCEEHHPRPKVVIVVAVSLVAFILFFSHVCSALLNFRLLSLMVAQVLPQLQDCTYLLPGEKEGRELRQV